MKKMSFFGLVNVILVLEVCIFFLYYHEIANGSHPADNDDNIIHSHVNYGDVDDDEDKKIRKEIYELIDIAEKKNGTNPNNNYYRIIHKTKKIERIPRESQPKLLPSLPPSDGNSFSLNSIRSGEEKKYKPVDKTKYRVKYYEPIRVALFVDDLASLAPEDERIMKFFVGDVFPAALEYLSRVVKVQRGVKSFTNFKRFCASEWIGGEENLKQSRACSEIANEKMQSCLGANIPAEHLDDVYLCKNSPDFSTKNCKFLKGGRGIKNADLVLYVTAKDVDACKESKLIGEFCMMDQFDRPISAKLNICLTAIKKPERYTWRDSVVLVLHEIFHSLGFSSNAFPFFRLPNAYYNHPNFQNANPSIPLTPRDSDRMPPRQDIFPFRYRASTKTTLKNIDKQGGKITPFLITKNVKKIARKYFNCTEINGIPLERRDYYGLKGDLNTAMPGDHLEKKTFNEDFMTSPMNPFPQVSKISLAVLEDSGWYKVNYQRAGEPLWGRGPFLKDSCKFFFDTCLSGDKANPIPVDEAHFCSPKLLEFIFQCTHNLKSIGLCYTELRSTSLPQHFQYFSDSRIGGIHESMDFCPVYEHAPIDDAELECINSKDMFSDSGFAELGPTGRCVESNLLKNDAEVIRKDNARCYQLECIPMDNGKKFSNNWKHVAINVRVHPNVEKVICTPDEEGMSKSVPGMSGALKCPNVMKACWNQPCQNDGVPRRSMCNCQPGYIGKYCEIPDTMKNRNLYPSHYHYRDLDDITVQVGSKYEIPASIMGPVTKFYEITPLPKGLKLNPTTGAIEGIPQEPTINFNCKTYTLGAMNERTEHKDGKPYETRTTIRIRVVRLYTFIFGVINIKGECPKFLFEFNPPKPTTHDINETSNTNDKTDSRSTSTDSQNEKNRKRKYEFVYSDFSNLPGDMAYRAKNYMKGIYSSFLRTPSMAESRYIKYYSVNLTRKRKNDWGILQEKNELSHFQFANDKKRNADSFKNSNIIDYIRELDGFSEDFFSTEIEEKKTHAGNFVYKIPSLLGDNSYFEGTNDENDKEENEKKDTN